LIAAVFAAVLASGAGLRADDTVTLKDGSSLQGQVMEETDAQVVLMDHGVQRTLDRSLVARVDFNTSPSSDSGAPAAAPAPDSPAGAGDAVPPSGAGEPAGFDATGSGPQQPTQEQMDYANGISDYYQVDPDQVWGFEEQGIPVEELPVVFYVARRAQCAPGLVADMRLQGMSWADICMHFGLGPGIFYWNDVFAVDLGGPYDGVYWGFHRHRRDYWRWDVLALSDGDIINCVNLRFSTAYWHRTPYEVAQWRIGGHHYYWGGYSRGRGRFRQGGLRVRVGVGYGGPGGHGGYGVHGGAYAGNHGSYAVHGHNGHVRNGGGHGGHGGGGHASGGSSSHDSQKWNHN
jgi:hypothetical protein